MIQAMADCQTLAEDCSLNANDYYLTGCVAVFAMDSYDEASSNFSKPMEVILLMRWRSRSTRHIWDRIWRLTATKYLEAALKTRQRQPMITVKTWQSLLLYG